MHHGKKPDASKLAQALGTAFPSILSDGRDKRAHEDRAFNWVIDDETRHWRDKCIARALEEGAAKGIRVDHRLLQADFVVVHNHCGGLNFITLAMAPTPDFVNDVVGITVNLDRRAGVLLNGWKPIHTLARSHDLR